MKAYIKAIEYYLPESELTNEQLVELFPEWTVEKVASKIGIKKRHIASKDEFASDMAVAAVEKLLISRPDLDKNAIDFILLCTQSPDYFLPTTACFVQNRLGLSTRCGALDFNQGCSGYVYGLSLAKGLICGGIAKNILLITSETYSKHIHWSDKSNRTIFGDAATVSWISSNGFAEIGNFVLGTDGSGAENLIVKGGAMRQPFTNENQVQDVATRLYMNGSEIFSFTLEAVPELVHQTMKANNVTTSEVDKYIFHQANQHMLTFLRKKTQIPLEKFPVYMEDCGNTVSSTIPIVLQELIKQNQIKEHSNILLAGFGVGYSWGGVLLRF
jgi:3-oxoacyl-[acyl-carrier-protein] synthase-3